jgi:competence protein ComEC
VAQAAVLDASADVTADPHPIAAGRPGAEQLVAVGVRLRMVAARGRRVASDVPVLVLGGGGWGGVSAGQRVELVGRLRPAEPGDDVVAVVVALGPPRAVQPGGWPWRAADRLRSGLRQACAGLPQDAGGLLPSLVVGDTTALPARLRDDLRTAGLTHITAVSGANVAIVVGTAIWLAARIGAGRRLRLVLAGGVLVGFVVLARPQPSVLRAAAMAAVALIGLALARRVRGVPVLAGAALLLLLVDPWLARSAGFALSCVATAALVLLAPAWARALSRHLPAPIATALAVPAAAQAACGPVLVLLQPSVSLAAVPANLLAEPAVAPATVVGVLAAAVAPVWPTGGHALAWLASWATGWIAAVAHRLASTPVAALPWPGGIAGALLLAALTAALVGITMLGQRRRLTGPGDSHEPTGPGSPSRTAGRAADRAAGRAAGRAARRRSPIRVLLTAGAATVLLLAGLLLWFRPRLPPRFGGRWPPAGWAVVQCDVGQGDAMALRSGPDRAVLVDAGPEPERVRGCLDRLGVHHLDLVVLTHHHADHVDGLPGAVQGHPAEHLLVSPLAQPEANAGWVRRWAARAGIEVTLGWAGEYGRLDDGVWHLRWRVLEPDRPPTPAVDAEQPDGTAVNQSSLVTQFEVDGPGGPLRVIGLGDLEVEGQQHLAERLAGGGLDALGGPPDVVKVAHHGSARQDPDLYRMLRARVALIGVGAGNDYGHPAPSALGLLATTGSTVFRTDRDGDIALVPAAGGAVQVVPRR